ncbi:2-hydroxyacid dehydrogenase [Desulforamulus aquiferis]|nr:hydroxyacid dehydrogenase [Desulforamulus aquiferis]RYD04136.1 2-hydroxyacid dehydrogenase [Desulforamulus aquiferis]
MKAVVTELIWEEGLEVLREQGEVKYDQNLWKSDNLLETIKDADLLIVRNQTKVTRELMEQAPNLKVVGRLGVGLDNIDVAAAKELNIKVVFARNANAVSVAEYVFSAMFAFSRPLEKASQDVKKGNWNRKLFTREEIYGKTLGLVGVGEISARLASRAKAFGMNVIGFDPFLPPYELACTDIGVRMDSLEKVLAESDYVSLHVPLNDQTRNLINRDSIKTMKKTAYVINTARGGVINEDDLYEAIKAGEIAGAALDVLIKEPPQGNKLLELENVIVTPHIAGLTEEAQVRTSELVARECLKVLKGRALCA